MALTDMYVFNEQVQVVATETVDQAVEKFNDASGGALILGNEMHIGDYLEKASYKTIPNLVKRRNAYGNSSVIAQPIQQMLDRGVKIDSIIGPLVWTPEQFRRLGKSEEEAGLIIGEQAASALVQDYLNTACSAAVNAISQNTNLVYDATAGSISLRTLNKGTKLFGDRSSSIIAWLMHSAIWHDLQDEALTNANNLFKIGDVNVMEDSVGRRYVVTDSPALMTTGTPDTYHTIGLVGGAIQIQTDTVHSVTQDTTGQENLGKIFQGESSFTLGMLGYAWDAGTGGKSPSNAALAAGANWSKFVTSDKDTMGVLVNSL